MTLSTQKAWFNGPYVGAGLSLPLVWQGWAVLGGGMLTALMSGAFLHGTARELTPVLALLATRVVIQIKRAG